MEKKVKITKKKKKFEKETQAVRTQKQSLKKEGGLDSSVQRTAN